MAASNSHSVAVVGGGPAGLAAALGLARTGLDVAVLAPAPHAPGSNPDRRTAALFAGSIELLRNLGAWEACQEDSAALRAIRLIDDTGALLRAPEVMFTAADAGRDSFGHNIPNAVLAAALMKAIRKPGSGVDFIETQGVTSLDIGANSVRLTLAEGGAHEARLVAGADGRNSICRASAGIGTRDWTYPQSALVCSFSHTRPHISVSTEFHRRTGPCTTVPMKGNASSLVWVEEPGEARRLAALGDDAFRTVLERQLQGLLGSAGDIGPRSAFPLSGLTAETFGHRRVALVGEAGHVMPPIGAQGLNLGLRDAAALADCVAEALAERRDIGGAATVEGYARARAIDVSSRVWTIDLLNRSLLSDILPVHLARGLGLHALKAIGPLRRLLVREGLQPSYATPTLMQTDGAARLAHRCAGADIAVSSRTA